ncbi:hypothetical protein PROFUN_07377 [Planoprotostelium fungivorum]|uniref:Uncharacterized protein n=1 Tax=Planoprotostelium fungivorum TaxID=1890364 RepID=A0A2P6MTH5_9EUKA|nr:hypothetical protein PROFUN_07377 [Planoprotostelium fungivorum]
MKKSYNIGDALPHCLMMCFTKSFDGKQIRDLLKEHFEVIPEIVVRYKAQCAAIVFEDATTVSRLLEISEVRTAGYALSFYVFKVTKNSNNFIDFEQEMRLRDKKKRKQARTQRGGVTPSRSLKTGEEKTAASHTWVIPSSTHIETKAWKILPITTDSPIDSAESDDYPTLMSLGEKRANMEEAEEREDNKEEKEETEEEKRAEEIEEEKEETGEEKEEEIEEEKTQETEEEEKREETEEEEKREETGEEEREETGEEEREETGEEEREEIEEEKREEIEEEKREAEESQRRDIQRLQEEKRRLIQELKELEDRVKSPQGHSTVTSPSNGIERVQLQPANPGQFLLSLPQLRHVEMRRIFGENVPEESTHDWLSQLCSPSEATETPRQMTETDTLAKMTDEEVQMVMDMMSRRSRKNQRECHLFMHIESVTLTGISRFMSVEKTECIPISCRDLHLHLTSMERPEIDIHHHIDHRITIIFHLSPRHDADDAHWTFSLELEDKVMRVHLLAQVCDEDVTWCHERSMCRLEVEAMQMKRVRMYADETCLVLQFPLSVGA